MTKYPKLLEMLLIERLYQIIILIMLIQVSSKPMDHLKYMITLNIKENSMLISNLIRMKRIRTLLKKNSNNTSFQFLMKKSRSF
jgi:hypothetical protein